MRCGSVLVLICSMVVICAGVVANVFAETTPRRILRLKLGQALELAMDSNRRLRTVRNEVENRRLSVSAARSAFEFKMGPSAAIGYGMGDEALGAGASVSKKFESGIRANLGIGIEHSGGSNDAVVDASLRIPLLKGFGVRYNLDSVYDSLFAVRTARRSLYRNMVNVTLDTVTTFYEIAKGIRLVALYRQGVERFRMHVASARLKERVGVATPMDVYRAEIRLKDTENNLNLAKEALRNVRDQLKVILALPLDIGLDVETDIPFQPLDLGQTEAVRIALKNRIELEQVSDEVREAERKAAIAKENLRPQLDFAVDYRKYSEFQEYEKGFNLNGDYWSVRLIGNGDWRKTAEKAAYKQHLLGVADARLHSAVVREEIIREVRRKLEEIKKMEGRIAIQDRQVDNAAAKLLLAQLKFSHGMADNFDVIESENELQQAKAALLNLKVKHVVGRYQLRAQLGTLVDRP